VAKKKKGWLQKAQNSNIKKDDNRLSYLKTQILNIFTIGKIWGKIKAVSIRF
jgi:hypothetical protein